MLLVKSKVILEVKGKKYPVQNCSYSFRQNVDFDGQPSSIARCTEIKITMESTGDTTFLEWMCDSYARGDGTITFLERDTEKTLQELSFKEAYMVEFNESFDESGTGLLSFTLSPREISIGDAEHKNEWIVSSQE
jgi:hypothetical protein